MKKAVATRLSVVALASSLAAGCATDGPLGNMADSFGLNGYESGVEVSEKQMDRIEPGMSKAEVESIVGPAPEVETSEKAEIWSYPYQHIPHFGANVSETTIVRFDSNDQVTKAYKVDGGGASGNSNPLTEAAE